MSPTTPPPPPTYPSLYRTRWSSPPSSSQTQPHLEIHNPATGALITTLIPGTPSTAHFAITSAQAAFTSHWRHTTLSQRSVYLLRCADHLEAHAEELACLLCLENGKPYQDALAFDVKFLVGVFRYFGGLIDKLPVGEYYDQGCVDVVTVREAYGVVAGILP